MGNVAAESRDGSLRLRSVAWPGLMTAAMLGLLIGLGVWQLERLAWKRDLLAAIAHAEAGPAEPLADAPPPFAKVRVEGRFRPDLQALYGVAVHETPQGSEMGADAIVPLERSDGVPVLVDRGWVPVPPGPAVTAPPGPVTVEGFVRPAVQPRWFSLADDAPGRHFYTLDPAAIGAALGLRAVAPFTVVALGRPAPGTFPQPATSLPRPPNNHLAYAFTWFGLAGALAVVFLAWARKVLQR